MGEPPPKTSLDRKDNDGSYCKDNCRWGTKIEQMSNRSNCRYLTYNAETKTAAEWARHLGIGHSALLARINRGWPLERVLSERSNAPSDASTVVRVALLDGFSSGFLGFGA
jgi:hypothetical protein